MEMKMSATLTKVKLNTNNTRGPNFIAIKLATSLFNKTAVWRPIAQDKQDTA
jgi:hypothetical protein